MSAYRNDRRLVKGINWNPSSDPIQQLKALEEIFIFSKGFRPHTSCEVDIDIAHLTASKDVCIKKLVYLYLSLASHCNNDIFILAMNSASNDLRDPNPIVRSFTLHSIGEVSINPTNWDFIFQAVLNGLQDASSNVRSNALNSIIQLHQKQLIRECDLSKNGSNLNVLFEKVISTVNRDPDPSVVMRSLECLAICKQDHELVHNVIVSLLDKIMLLDSYLALKLLHRAGISLQETKLCMEEKFHILNKIEPLRQLSLNFSMTVETCMLMLKLSLGLENIHKDVLDEVVSSLFGLLMVSNKTARHFILCNLLSILKCYHSFLKEKFVSNLNLFILLSDDASCVLVKKVNILKFCVNDKTAEIIFNNIRPYFHYAVYPNVVEASFFLLETLNQFMSKICHNILYCSMYSDSAVVVECAIVTYYNLTISQGHPPSLSTGFTKALLESYKHLKHEDARSCFLQIICFVNDKQHSKDISKVLKKEILLFSESSLCHQSCILHFALHTFLQWHHMFYLYVKELFIKLFQTPEESFVYEQGKLYYKLLKEDKELLKKLVASTFECLLLPKHRKLYKTVLRFNDVDIASIVI